MIYSLVPKGIGISPGSVMVGHKQCSALFMGQYLVLSKRLTFCNGEVILKVRTCGDNHYISKFQSPQWGSNSKVCDVIGNEIAACFSPRNGEVILKTIMLTLELNRKCFSPRNGEVILKIEEITCNTLLKCFSPRNGEVILKP